MIPPRLLWLGSLLAATSFYLTFGPAGDFVGLYSDSAAYLLLADYHAPAGSPDAVASYIHQVAQFPQAFPLLLAYAGGGSRRLAIAHLVQSLCLLTAMVLSARLIARLAGNALLGVAAFWLLLLLPPTILLSAEIWSEFTYLAFASGALLLALAAAERPAYWWGAALLAGMAAATRSIGIALVLALALALWKQAPRRAWPALLLALLPVLLLGSRAVSGGGQYLSIFVDRWLGPTALLRAVQTNVVGLWHGWLGLFALRPQAWIAVAGGAALLLAGVGWWTRLRAWGIEAFYALGYALLLLVWPFPDFMDRLIYPLAPILFAFVVLGWQRLFSGALAVPWRLTGLPIAVLLLCTVPDAGRILWRYLAVTPPAAPGARSSRYWLIPATVPEARADVNVHADMIRFMKQAGALVSPDDCIYSVHQAQLMFFSRRISIYPVQGAARDSGPFCRYHLVLGDAQFERGVAGLWEPRETVLSVPSGDGIAGLLVRYPAVQPVAPP